MIGLHRRKPGRHFIDGFSGKLSTRFHMMDYRIKPSKYGLGDECLRCLRNCLEDKNGGIKSAFLFTQAGIFHGGLLVFSAGLISGLSCEAEAHRALDGWLCALILII